MPIRLSALAFLLAFVAPTADALSPPQICPPTGLCLPVEFVRARDADTIEWRLPGSAFVFASRLIDVWSPETRGGNQFTRAIAERGKAFAANQCIRAERLRVFIPLPRGEQPLKSLTFDRIPSYIYLNDTETLNQLVVENKFASSTKGGELGQ